MQNIQKVAVDGASSGEKTTVHRSSCGACHGGCGVLVYVTNGKVSKVEGDPAYPLNQGSLCSKGLAAIEHTYNPGRLLYPMKRTGARGEGKWQRISWDEALGTIAENVNEIKAKYGPEAIAIGQGTGRHHFLSVVRFANALGTPNWCEPGRAQCFHPRLMVSLLTFGDYPVADHYGEVPPGLVLVWGHNPAASGPDGELGAALLRSLNRGARLVVVDPRLSETAVRANVRLQVRPGMDAALALAMLNIIVTEGLYDAEFVRNYTVGFEALVERLERHTPEWAEPITWVPASQIRETARLFATTKPACIEWGVALEHTPNALQNMRSLAILAAITGNIDVPGGNVFGMHALKPTPLLYDQVSEASRAKRLGADRFKLNCGEESVLPSAHIPTLFRAMRTGQPYPVRAFLIFGNNALVTYANPRAVYEAMMMQDFVAVADIYMTPTAELADIVLPAATWLETDQVAGYPIRAENVVVVRQKVVSVGESKQDEVFLGELAQRLGLRAGTEPLEDLLNYRLQPLGINFEQLKELGCVSVPMEYRKYEKSGFKTPSGKVELRSSTLDGLGYDPLPHYVEPPESPLSTPELVGKYPLVLTTGSRSPAFFHSEGRQVPSLRQLEPNPLADIHVETGEKLGIKDGDWIWVETLRGRGKWKARLTRGIDPRVVNVQHGWWFPEIPEPDHGVWESNANLLTSDMPPYDPAFGTYQLRALLCRVQKVEGP